MCVQSRGSTARTRAKQPSARGMAAKTARSHITLTITLIPAPTGVADANMPELSDEQLRSAYQQFRTGKLPDYYDKWHTDHVATIRDIAATSDDGLMSPAGQQKLWRAKGIGGIGPGEGVDVAGACDDIEIAKAIVETRSRPWSQDVKT